MRILSELNLHPEASEQLDRDPLRFEKVESSEREVEVMARRLYVAFYLGMQGSTKEEGEQMWLRLKNGKAISSVEAYKGWLAVAMEALK